MAEVRAGEGGDRTLETSIRGMEGALTEAVEIGRLQRQQHRPMAHSFPRGQRRSFITASRRRNILNAR